MSLQAAEKDQGCPAALIVKGKHALCDVPAPHDGWPHASMRLEAVWGEAGDEGIPSSEVSA